jgi:hypothetical protein
MLLSQKLPVVRVMQQVQKREGEAVIGVRVRVVRVMKAGVVEL